MNPMKTLTLQTFTATPAKYDTRTTIEAWLGCQSGVHARRFLSILLIGLAMLECANTAFAIPFIFNATESAAPGDVIYIQGDNFVVNATNPTVWFRLVSGTENTLTPSVQLNSTAIASVSNQMITVNLPANIPMGLYAVWVKDSGGNLSAPVMVNKARATSFEYSEVSPGYTFRLFGRNLTFPRVTPSVKFVNGGNSYVATVVATYTNDSNVLQVQTPGNLPTSGIYTVTVSNGYGSGTANFDVATAEKTILGRTGGTDPFNLGVPWGPDFSAIALNKIDVTKAPYNADNTGGTNALVPIQQAIAAAKAAPNGGTVYLPTGTYLIDKGAAVTAFDIPAKVVLQGDGIDQTIINDASQAMTGASHFITMSATSPNSGSLSGLTGFTYNQIMTVTASTTFPPDIRNYAANSSKMFFDHIKVNFAHGLFNSNTSVVYGAFIPQSSNDTEVLTQNCTMSYLRFGNNNFYAYGFTNGSDYIFRNNSFSQFFARLEFLYINNLLIEGNHFTRDGTFPPANWGGALNCGGIEASGADHKILNNTLDGINLPLPYYNDGESILCQNGPTYGSPSGTSDSGTVISATTNSLTDTSKNWIANAFKSELVWITNGPTQGAWAIVSSNTSTTLTLDRHLATAPAAASTYAILPADSYVLSTVTGSSSTTLSDTTQNWPTNFHQGDSVAIVNGPEMGQLRSIVSNTSNTLTVSPAWDELPTTSSKYSINGALSFGAQRWLVKGNTLHDVTRGIILYLGGYDCVVTNNRLASSGGIFMAGWQRNTVNTVAYNRFDLGWNNLFADNIVNNPDTAASRAAYYAIHADMTANSPLFGTIIFGAENRRNILQASTPNLRDNQFGADESMANIVIEEGTGNQNAYTGVKGALGTIYSDNLSVGSSYAYELTTADSQTTLWNQLSLNYTNLIKDTALAGGTQTSLLTTNSGDPCFLTANFNGIGTSTGGSTDMVYTGAAGSLAAGSGQSSIGISSSNPFTTDNAFYLSISTDATGNGAYVQMTPTTVRTSWGRIFDGRMIPAPTNGKWLVNGGFDFFWRPAQSPSAANAMRPIDISNNDATNGLRLTFENISGSTLRHEIITGAGGGGATLTGTYPSGFAANQVYHVGVTYSTDAITGVTAAKMFAVSGTGAIITSGSNAATPITTATFTLNPGVVTNTTGFLSNGTWAFGDWSANGTIRSNDYGSLRLYSQDPGVFPAFPVNVSNANLSNLALSAGTLSPAFVSGTTSYTASVINSVNSITVTPTAAQANATVTVNGVSVISGVASSSISLNVGTNTITAVVTAQDGVTIQTYTVTLTRAPDRKSTRLNSSHRH